MIGYSDNIVKSNLSSCVVSSGQQFLAQRNAGREIVSSGVDFSFQTLVIVHQKLNSTYITE